MNVFIIPSWYPSEDEPHTGIFFKEQAEALAYIFPESSFAISTWGSHKADLLLHVKDHLKNIPKLLRVAFKNPQQRQLKPNLTEYYTPAFTWTRKILEGNINNIIKANEKHLLEFESKVGKVDVIHAHTAHPAGWVAMKLAAKYNIPYIITEHMGPFPFASFRTKSGKLSNWLAQPLQKAFANIAVSPQQQKTLQEWGIPKVTHIPNLTDETIFTPKPEEVTEPFTFFTLARLEEGKGIQYLLQAFKLLTETAPDLKLKVGGEGTQLENYKLQAAALGITDKVEWLGLLDRQATVKHYQTCSTFVLPSLHENLPLVLLEAMACGKPLISTYCGGPESIITPETGLVVEPGNAVALKEAMSQLYKNYSNYNSEQIRQLFCSRYARAIVCKQIMEVYKAAAETKSK